MTFFCREALQGWPRQIGLEQYDSGQSVCVNHFGDQFGPVHLSAVPWPLLKPNFAIASEVSNSLRGSLAKAGFSATKMQLAKLKEAPSSPLFREKLKGNN